MNVDEHKPTIHFCINCGKEVPSVAHFCPYCGTKVYVASDDANEKVGIIAEQPLQPSNSKKTEDKTQNESQSDDDSSSFGIKFAAAICVLLIFWGIRACINKQNEETQELLIEYAKKHPILKQKTYSDSISEELNRRMAHLDSVGVQLKRDQQRRDSEMQIINQRARQINEAFNAQKSREAKQKESSSVSSSTSVDVGTVERDQARKQLQDYYKKKQTQFPKRIADGIYLEKVVFTEDYIHLQYKIIGFEPEDVYNSLGSNLKSELVKSIKAGNNNEIKYMYSRIKTAGYKEKHTYRNDKGKFLVEFIISPDDIL